MDNSKYLHSIGVIYIFSHSGSPFRLWFYQIHRSKGWLKSIILSFLMMNNNLMNHNSHKTVPANPPLSQTSRTFQVLDALSHTLTQHANFFLIIYQMKFFTKYLRTRICLCFSFDSCSSTSEYNTSNSSQKQESTQAENLLQIAEKWKTKSFSRLFLLHYKSHSNCIFQHLS